MPWVDKNECTGCGICVEECPVDTISMEKCLKRMIKYFNKERIVAEKTLEKLQMLERT